MRHPVKLNRRMLRATRRNRRQAGYTLLELLVVMGILAVLTAIATPQVMSYFNKAKSESVQLQIQNINTALELYYMENGTYPSSDEGLRALVEAPADAPRWSGPYLKQTQALTDPWGHPYQYVYPNEAGQYTVYSLGSKNTVRTADIRASVVRQ